jgi:hypothetical protein
LKILIAANGNGHSVIAASDERLKDLNEMRAPECGKREGA